MNAPNTNEQTRVNMQGFQLKNYIGSTYVDKVIAYI